MNDNDSEDEKRVTFGCPTHSASLLSEMNKRRATDYDIEIAADGKLFQVHKLVLLAESPYFEAMFNSGMREAQSQMIELSDISHHIMEVLIEFMYTSKVSVTANNVYELLHAADLLQMVKVRDFCTNYLVKMLTVANCFSMLDVGKMYSNDPLVNQIVKYISLNLETISDTKEFLSLSLDDLNFVVQSRFLIYAPEEDIYLSLMKWIKFDLDNRKQQIYPIICNVKLPLIKRSFLIKIMAKDPLIFGDAACYQKIVAYYEALLLPDDPGIGSIIKDKASSTREQSSTDESMHSEPELITTGQHDKEFEDKIIILGLEFRLSPEAIERMKRCPVTARRRIMWPIQIQYWCDHQNGWDILLKSHFQTTIIPDHTFNTLRLNKPLRTRKLRIHVHEAPPNTFRVTFITPKPFHELT